MCNFFNTCSEYVQLKTQANLHKLDLDPLKSDIEYEFRYSNEMKLDSNIQNSRKWNLNDYSP